MRVVLGQIGRSVVAVAIVASIAVPLQAKPAGEGWSPDKIVKVVKRLVVKSLGDWITTPRP
jgi:hypothetical protein